jgi:hypothetical protein
MINKIWNRMMKIKADKFWHFIAFREFTAILIRTGLPLAWILIITITLGIGKEIYDWYKGQYIDYGDLFADALGILMGFIN